MGAAGSPPQGFAADLEEALIVYEGWLNNGANQTVFSCTNLSGYPNYEGNQVIIDYPWGGFGQARQIVGDTSNGTVIMDAPLSSTPGAGATFKIVGIRITPYNVSQIQADVKEIQANQTAHYNANVTQHAGVIANQSFMIPYLADIQTNTTILYWLNKTNWASIVTNETALYLEVTSLDLNQSAIISNESAIYEANSSYFHSLNINTSAIYGANLTYWNSIVTNQTSIKLEIIGLSVNQTAILANESALYRMNLTQWGSIATNQTAILANQTQLITDLDNLTSARYWTLTDGTEQTLFNLTNSVPYYFLGGNINLSNVSTGTNTEGLFILQVKKILGLGLDFVPSIYSNITYSEIYRSPIIEIDGFPNTYGVQVTLQQTNNSNVSVYSEWYYQY